MLQLNTIFKNLKSVSHTGCCHLALNCIKKYVKNPISVKLSQDYPLFGRQNVVAIFCIGTKCRSSNLNDEFKLLLVDVELRGKDQFSEV